jgi:hypothetical protein
MLWAGEKLNPILAAGMVAILQRETASTAQANGRLRVATAQGCSVALPPVTGDITEVPVAHFASLVVDSFGLL